MISLEIIIKFFKLCFGIKKMQAECLATTKSRRRKRKGQPRKFVSETNITPFKCEFCERLFKAKKGLVVHMKCIHGLSRWDLFLFKNHLNFCCTFMCSKTPVTSYIFYISDLIFTIIQGKLCILLELL